MRLPADAVFGKRAVDFGVDPRRRGGFVGRSSAGSDREGDQQRDRRDAGGLDQRRGRIPILEPAAGQLLRDGGVSRLSDCDATVGRAGRGRHDEGRFRVGCGPDHRVDDGNRSGAARADNGEHDPGCRGQPAGAGTADQEPGLHGSNAAVAGRDSGPEFGPRRQQRLGQLLRHGRTEQVGLVGGRGLQRRGDDGRFGHFRGDPDAFGAGSDPGVSGVVSGLFGRVRPDRLGGDQRCGEVPAATTSTAALSTLSATTPSTRIRSRWSAV